jgi:hypothetical protein
VSDFENIDFELPEEDNAENFWGDVDFSESFSTEFTDPEKNRYIKPPRQRPTPVKYEYAAQLAKQLKIEKDCNYFALVSGNFILGDIFEAIAVEQRIQYQRLDISTLSLSHDNVDSLRNLQMHNYAKKINLIVSDYFFAHERNDIVKYIYQELDRDNTFQLAVAGIHTKICSFETHTGLKIVIHGSGNLRSSRNVEQISIQESAELYDFIQDYNDKMIKKYATIRKGIRAEKLWELVN